MAVYSELTLHSGDLTTPCMRQRQLRRDGKYTSEMPTAMYRGNLFGWSCTGLARANRYDEDAVVEACGWATAKVQDDMRNEGRKFTAAVERNAGDIHAEVAQAVLEYARRLGPMLASCRIIGSELPIYWELHVHVAGPTSRKTIVPVSSHLDLLFRDLDGVFGWGRNKLIFFDWKYTQEAPTKEYLARAPQFMLYTLALRHGQVQLGPDDWASFEEWPIGAFVHAPSLLPYGRAGKSYDDGGQLVEYKAGDERPLNRIIRWTPYEPSRESDMLDELILRAYMMVRGIYPQQPDPLGCHLCDSQPWCPRFDMRNDPYVDDPSAAV